MNRFAIPAVIVSAAMLLSAAAQAMDIIHFDLMTTRDQQSFLDFLPTAAQMVLNQEGRSADAAKVHQLFMTFVPVITCQWARLNLN